ncbi:aldo/keto reductase [Streptomyces albidoflavus]|uniref:aldo/keto reductase n=1 Tax=Streptomyces koyangensis TaxID=188770 RepID=UPI003D025859|nr:aldo/keto reductase [Streptomyces albidoflavus]
MTRPARQMTSVRLNNGVEMPLLGLGSFQIPEDALGETVRIAGEAGYRAVDTARIYENERAVGEALARSGLERDEVFVISKLWNSDQGYDAALRAYDRSLDELGLDRLDLYLVHWPAPGLGRYPETWRALCWLLGEGRVRAIGVSNFQPAHLRRVIDETGVVPAVNQIESHPWLQQDELRAVHGELGIVTQAWGPLGQGHGVLSEPVVGELAERYGRTPAQIVLRWHLQLGHALVPKSARPDRVRENARIFDFTLDDAAMAALRGCHRGKRLGPDPDTFDHG